MKPALPQIWWCQIQTQTLQYLQGAPTHSKHHPEGELVFHDGSMGMQDPTTKEGAAHAPHTCPKYQLLPPPPLEAQGSHLEFSSMPQIGQKSAQRQQIKWGGSWHREGFPQWRVPRAGAAKGLHPTEAPRGAARSAWVTPDSALEMNLEPLGCHQTMGDIPPVTLWRSPTVISCTQPKAQDQQPWKTLFSKGAGYGPHAPWINLGFSRCFPLPPSYSSCRVLGNSTTFPACYPHSQL